MGKRLFPHSFSEASGSGAPAYLTFSFIYFSAPSGVRSFGWGSAAGRRPVASVRSERLSRTFKSTAQNWATVRVCPVSDLHDRRRSCLIRFSPPPPSRPRTPAIKVGPDHMSPVNIASARRPLIPPARRSLSRRLNDPINVYEQTSLKSMRRNNPAGAARPERALVVICPTLRSPEVFPLLFSLEATKISEGEFSSSNPLLFI